MGVCSRCGVLIYKREGAKCCLIVWPERSAFHQSSIASEQCKDMRNLPELPPVDVVCRHT